MNIKLFDKPKWVMVFKRCIITLDQENADLLDIPKRFDCMVEVETIHGYNCTHKGKGNYFIPKRFIKTIKEVNKK